MSERPPVGTIIEQPGFRGEVIGFFSGLMVVEGHLQGALGTHAAEADEFAFVIEGEVTVTIGETRSVLTAGKSIIVPAGTLHEVEASHPARVLLIG